MTINSTNSKYVFAGRDKGRPSSGVSSKVMIDKDVFEVVKEFIFLGTLVTMTVPVERKGVLQLRIESFMDCVTT